MRVCGVCRHRKLDQIDHALLAGEAQAAVARKFRLSPDVVNRHAKHMRSALSMALAKNQPNRSHDVSYGNELLDALNRIIGDVEHVQQQAQDARDLRTTLLATRQRADLVELRAKLQGVLESEHGSVTNNILNLNIPESTLRKMAATYLENHPALPEAQPDGADSPDGLLTLPTGIVEGSGNG